MHVFVYISSVTRQIFTGEKVISNERNEKKTFIPNKVVSESLTFCWTIKQKQPKASQMLLSFAFTLFPLGVACPCLVYFPFLRGKSRLTRLLCPLCARLDFWSGLLNITKLGINVMPSDACMFLFSKISNNMAETGTYETEVVLPPYNMRSCIDVWCAWRSCENINYAFSFTAIANWRLNTWQFVWR
jgi:hypothetical protein